MTTRIEMICDMTTVPGFRFIVTPHEESPGGCIPGYLGIHGVNCDATLEITTQQAEDLILNLRAGCDSVYAHGKELAA